MSSGIPQTLQDVAFANNLFVAVGHNGTILTSPASSSGGVWNPQSSGTATVLNGVASRNAGGSSTGAEWVVVGHNGTVLYSPAANASTWSPVPAGGLPPALGSTLLEQVTYGGPAGGQLYVAVGWNGTIITSPGGLNWAQPSSGTGANLADVEYAGGQYVVAGWNGTILTSPNGASWTLQSSGATANLYDLAFGAGTWVVVGAQGTILYSANGVNWNAAASGTSLDLYDVIYDGCRFVASGAGGTILTSPDGLNWTPDTSGTTARLLGLASGNGVDVAVGDGGTVLTAKGCQPAGGQCAPLPTDAVAWWPLNETSGAATVSDIVGGHTGTAVFGPVGSGGPNSATGMVGGALYFTSQTTYVRVPDSPALNFGSGDFTIDAWVNPVQVDPSRYQPIVDKTQATGGPGGFQGYRLYIKNGQAIFLVADGSTSALVSAPVTYGTWQFIAAERAGTSLNLYVNGALAATQSLPPGFGSVSNAADLLLGGITAVGSPVKLIIGEIALDEVELFSRALTAQEVKAIHTAGPAGKCPPPTGKPDLAVAKKPMESLVAGQQVTYQITVSNVGTAPANGPIVVTDTLGPGLTYVSAGGSGWTCSASGSTVTCTHPGPVPAGGSLPPITLTVNVAPDAKEIKNCAKVTAVKTVVQQTPAGPMDVEVPVPDANPANDEACDVSPVGTGLGMICGVKFLDHDGDGQQDPGEPGLPNWAIQVKDAPGNVIGTAVTGPKGRFCLEVKPGSYTVAEVVKPGWVQTAPQPVPPGTASVTVAAGQTAIVEFGNRPEQKPCCLTFTLQGGKADDFSTADGATAEPASPVPNAPAAWSGSYFDQTQVNKAFAHRFTLPQGNCVREAKLEVRAKPLGEQPENDRIYLYSPFGSAAQWVANFGTGSGNAGGANLLSSPWTTASYGGGQIFTLDLAALPLPSGGTTSLLPALDASRTLDLVVQDDTSVDYARLTVTFCECAQGEAAALAGEARPAPSEVRMFIGKPVLLSDGMDRGIDVPPVIRGGRTFLPVRALAEALGLDVAWDPTERKLTLTNPVEDPPTRVELWVGRSGAKLTKADAAREVSIDAANPGVAPFIEKGRVMLPVRFIAESLGLEVTFGTEEADGGQVQRLVIREKSFCGRHPQLCQKQN